MSRFNKSTGPAGPGPAVTEAVPTGTTYEGAPGYARDAKSDLYLLAVTHMGDGSFYETAAERGSRFTDLVRQVAVADPAWMAGFLPWLREEANMRTAAVIAGAEAAKALLDAGLPGGRQMISRALRRADEPGELLAYWASRYGAPGEGGRAMRLPKPVKRGVADAAMALWAEYPLLKYDTGSHGIRFADVLALTHAGDRKGSSQGGRFKGPWQRDLFGYAIGRRYGRDEAPESLAMIRANQALRELAGESPSALLDPAALRAAGMTWEDVLSLAGAALPKKDLWEALIPAMGYMALLRNLRNMDDAGVDDAHAQAVIARLTDPAQVAGSRQFPFRFLAAHRAVATGSRWAAALETALNLSMANVPELPGRTLVLVDRSGSMFDRVSAKSGLNRADTAAIFGAALALRSAGADLAQFGTGSERVPFTAGESVLTVVGRFRGMGGTETAAAVKAHLTREHTRVVILTDEQAWAGYGDPLSLIPDAVPAYTWNLAGYKYGHGPSGITNRWTFGGLSDASFRLIRMLEDGPGPLAVEPPA